MFAECDDLRPPKTSVATESPFMLLEPVHLRLYAADSARSLPLASATARDMPSLPALSARCHVNPLVMTIAGLSPGDPVLVLALLEGWQSREGADREDTSAVTARSNRCTFVVESPHGGVGYERGGCQQRTGPLATQRSSSMDTIGGSRAAITGTTFATAEKGAAAAGAAATVSVDGDDDDNDATVGIDQSSEKDEQKTERAASNANAPLEAPYQLSKVQRQHFQQQPHQRRQVRSSAMKNLRCFLCTAWANSRLGPKEASVDGRVSVPVSLLAKHAELLSDQRIDPQCLAQENMRGSEYNNKRRDNTATSAGLKNGAQLSQTMAHLLEFLNAGIGYVSARSKSTGDAGAGTGSVVGIIPLYRYWGGGCGGGAGATLIPLAGRVSIRIVRSVSRRHANRSGAEDEPGAVLPCAEKTTCAATAAVESAGSVRMTPSKESEPDVPPTLISLSHHANINCASNPREESTRETRAIVPPVALPPEYTSLVKRSIRHLLVAEGCVIAVPGAGQPTEAGSRGGAGGAGVGGEHHPSEPSCGLTVSLARIDSFSTIGNGGAGGAVARTRGTRMPVHASPSAVTSRNHIASAESGRLGSDGSDLNCLTALLEGGNVCVIGPDAMLFVENGIGDDVSGTGDDGAKGLMLKREARVWGKVGAEEQQGSQASRKSSESAKGRSCGNAGMRGPRTPMGALVELILLPMTAPPPAQDGLMGLEFLIPRGVLLTGPPGVGKTFAVKSAVEYVRNIPTSGNGRGFQVHLTTLNGAEILSLGNWEACEALREAFSAAERWSQGVARGPGRLAGAWPDGRRALRRCALIFLDEADALLARRDRDGDRSAGGEGARALAQLLTLMDGFHKTRGSHVLVIGATNRPGALDPALRRPGRFDREIAVPPPDEDSRADILRYHLKAVQVIGGEATIAAVASLCVGYVGADLAALAREAALIAASRHRVGGDEDAAVGPADLAGAMEKVGASSLRGHQVTVPSTPWSAIGGMEEAKAKLRQAVEWPVANKEAFARMGLTPPRGILLYGPPGCSKTTLVRAAATAAGATFVSLSGADVFSPYLGEAEATIRQAFLLARNAAPALLFFDEIDGIVCKRGGGGKGSASSAESRVLATFLTEMDGVGALRGDGVIVVGATNRPEAVDKALLRPGRFDQVIYAPLPNKDARKQIFEVHTAKMAIDYAGVDFQTLAGVCEGLTGAEIEGICKEAAMSAIRETGFGDDRTESDYRQHENKGSLDVIVGNSGGADKDSKRPTVLPVVTMRHLLEAATQAAARPGVTKEMIEGYDRFASGL